MRWPRHSVGYRGLQQYFKIAILPIGRSFGQPIFEIARRVNELTRGLRSAGSDSRYSHSKLAGFRIDQARHDSEVFYSLPARPLPRGPGLSAGDLFANHVLPMLP